LDFSLCRQSISRAEKVQPEAAAVKSASMFRTRFALNKTGKQKERFRSILFDECPKKK
jgi:hypothetical protein